VDRLEDKIILLLDRIRYIQDQTSDRQTDVEDHTCEDRLEYKMRLQKVTKSAYCNYSNYYSSKECKKVFLQAFLISTIFTIKVRAH
jgi:hypothetical protein